MSTPARAGSRRTLAARRLRAAGLAGGLILLGLAAGFWLTRLERSGGETAAWVADVFRASDVLSVACLAFIAWYWLDERHGVHYMFALLQAVGAVALVGARPSFGVGSLALTLALVAVALIACLLGKRGLGRYSVAALGLLLCGMQVL